MTVYVVGREGSSLVKIGYSFNMPQRLASIRVEEKNDHSVKVLWESDPELGRLDEQKLHAIFRAYRRRGEWFDFGPADPVTLVSEAVKLPYGISVDPAPKPPVKPPKDDHWIDEQGHECFMNNGRKVTVLPDDEWEALPWPWDAMMEAATTTDPTEALREFIIAAGFTYPTMERRP